MTTAAPIALADWLETHCNGALDNRRQAAALLRTQHADLLRKDALLRQAQSELAIYTLIDSEIARLYDSIKQELLQ